MQDFESHVDWNGSELYLVCMLPVEVPLILYMIVGLMDMYLRLGYSLVCSIELSRTLNWMGWTQLGNHQEMIKYVLSD